MRSAIVFSALFTVAAAQSTATAAATTTEVEATNPTPDALDIAGIRDIPEPTYTTIDGLEDYDIPYESETAVATVSAEVLETPLSVFPAVTTVAINANGESDATATEAAAVRRDIESPFQPEKRTACATQATIPNYYNVDVSSYSKFKADTIIASVANAAPTPQGYYQTVKNALGANSAYGYLGYSVVKTYDVAACATKCTSKKGCLAFNIYFERDPVVEPGTGCTNPDAFANIKCSFWGSALDATTATNYGQYQSSFHVGIAGSNAYVSYSIGGPISGWEDALSLDNAAMNAPLRDCAGTWTYLGYKLFTSGPFDPSLCAAACDAQTEYNIAHPPSTGSAVRCGAFGTYVLTKTNSSGSYPQGQMCTMYTSAWESKYAVNTVSYDDSIGAKYTYSLSFFYSKASQQPVCPSDISYLLSNGAEFCTSYLSYTPSTSTAYTTSTPPVSTVLQTSTDTQYPTSTVTVYSTSLAYNYYKRQDGSDASNASIALVNSVDAPATTVPVPVTIDLATVTLSSTGLERRAVATPASVSGWAAGRISEACAQVATGVVTSTSTFQAAVPLTTLVSTITTTASAVTITTTVTTAATTSVQPTSSICAGPWSGRASGYGVPFYKTYTESGKRLSQLEYDSAYAPVITYFVNPVSIDQLVFACGLATLDARGGSSTFTLSYLKAEAKWECSAFWNDYNAAGNRLTIADSNVQTAYLYVFDVGQLQCKL